MLPRISLLTIRKVFLRPHVDFGDVNHDQPFNEFFYKKLESFQYKAALAIKGTIHGTSKEKNYGVMFRIEKSGH